MSRTTLAEQAVHALLAEPGITHATIERAAPHLGPFTVIRKSWSSSEWVIVNRLHTRDKVLRLMSQNIVASGTAAGCERACEHLNLAYAEHVMLKPDNPMAVQCLKCMGNSVTTGRVSSWCGNCGEVRNANL